MTKYYELAKEFGQKYVQPLVKDMDEKSQFPAEAFEKLGEEGYFGLLIPKELGGMGLGFQEHVDMCMGLAETSASAGLCYMMHNVATYCALNNGSEELRKIIAKEVIQKKKFLALAYSEFKTGTHFYIPELGVDFRDGTTVFNGYKSMVTSAGHASYYMVLAPSQDGKNIDNWLFPIDSSGLSFKTEQWHGLGMRGNVSCPMQLEDVELDNSWRVGEPASGLNQVLGYIAPPFIAGLAAVYTGTCTAVFKAAQEHAVKRAYPSGQKLSEIETVQLHLSNIYSLANSAKYATFEAARALDAGEADALSKVISARIVASEGSVEAARLAMRIGGGKAYNQAGPIERYLRDAYAGQIMAPSVDVLHVWLGKVLTDQPIP